MSLHNKETFELLYRNQVAELHDAELQMIADLPGVVLAAASHELKDALELHLAETKEQAARLAAIVDSMTGTRPEKFSDPMRALLANIRLLIASHKPSPVLDAALIATVQQVEHYEIASYGATLRLARMLDHESAAMLLRRSLKEESETSADLSQIGESVIMGEALEDAVLEESVSA